MSNFGGVNLLFIDDMHLVSQRWCQRFLLFSPNSHISFLKERFFVRIQSDNWTLSKTIFLPTNIKTSSSRELNSSVSKQPSLWTMAPWPQKAGTTPPCLAHVSTKISFKHDERSKSRPKSRILQVATFATPGNSSNPMGGLDVDWVIKSGQIIATSHDLTPHGGLVREIREI